MRQNRGSIHSSFYIHVISMKIGSLPVCCKKNCEYSLSTSEFFFQLWLWPIPWRVVRRLYLEGISLVVLQVRIQVVQ